MKRCLLRIQISHFLHLAMSLVKLMVAVSLASVGVILQGCGGAEEDALNVATNATIVVGGCDVSSAGQCATTFGTASITNAADTSALCAALQTYVTCIVDAGCCGDSTLRDALDTNIAARQTLCTGSDAVTNTCP